jgi:hypothetical protein
MWRSPWGAALSEEASAAPSTGGAATASCHGGCSRTSVCRGTVGGLAGSAVGSAPWTPPPPPPPRPHALPGNTVDDRCSACTNSSAAITAASPSGLDKRGPCASSASLATSDAPSSSPPQRRCRFLDFAAAAVGGGGYAPLAAARADPPAARALSTVASSRPCRAMAGVAWATSPPAAVASSLDTLMLRLRLLPSASHRCSPASGCTTASSCSAASGCACAAVGVRDCGCHCSCLAATGVRSTASVTAA